MAMTPDHYPRLHELAPGLLAGFGYNGRGIAMGTIMGRELARAAAGIPLEELVMPATRMRPLARYPFRRPLVSGAVRYYRWRDAIDGTIGRLLGIPS
jgi:glycine/D-amino acid oxidase-like deaminating enzyme